MKQTKKEYEKAFKTLNSLLIHSPFKDDPRDYNDLKVNVHFAIKKKELN